MKVIDERVKFYVMVIMAIVCFIAFVYYSHLHVTDPNVEVDRLIFGMLIAVMGGLLGIDILGGGGNRK